MATADGHLIEQRRRQRVARALANPAYFAEVYVRPYDPNWTSGLPSFAIDMLSFSLAQRRSVVMLPPEFLKTTLLSQVLPLWLIVDSVAREQQLRGMLLSEEERMAVGNLSVIAWHVVNNERIAADFIDSKGNPLIVPDPEEQVWREDAIIIKRPGASKDPTWQAKGLDSKGIHGRRLDWMIGDDVITPRNATSPALRKRALDVMDLVVLTRIVKTGKVLMAGNFNDPKDLLHTLSARKGWGTFKRPSMHMPGRPDVAPKESQLTEAELLWPDNWTRERLLEEYEATPNRFRRIHLMDPRAEHGERLNVGWVTIIEPDDTPLHYAKFFMALDPAPGGEGDDLDFFNITVVALHNRNLDLVESFDVRASPGRQATLVGMIHDRYNRIGQGVVAIGVSKVALDRYFEGVLDVVRDDLSHKVEGISTPGS
ncbi:hypothetical protein, partial [Mycobacterium sp.]|uniref:hypothetical protein n=1 Tax=Mycobacterium sp. TaxID=1785 RepID=UPI00262781F0